MAVSLKDEHLRAQLEPNKERGYVAIPVTALSKDYLYAALREALISVNEIALREGIAYSTVYHRMKKLPEDLVIDIDTAFAIADLWREANHMK